MSTTQPKKVYVYKYNMQFVYQIDKNGIHWWTEQGEYLGKTKGFTAHASHAILDNYIKEMRGL